MVSNPKSKDRTSTESSPPPPRAAPEDPADARPKAASAEKPARKKPDPTRYGDWEKKGRCIDF